MKTVQERLAAIADEVGLTWENVEGMTFRRFVLLVDKERARQKDRQVREDGLTMPGIGKVPS